MILLSLPAFHSLSFFFFFFQTNKRLPEKSMASWWHLQQQQQQIGEPFDYSLPPPHPSQTLISSQVFYDSHMIMIDSGQNDDYVMNTPNNGNINDSTSIDYHHRRNWFNG